jgi:hypothetical protein
MATDQTQILEAIRDVRESVQRVQERADTVVERVGGLDTRLARVEERACSREDARALIEAHGAACGSRRGIGVDWASVVKIVALIAAVGGASTATLSAILQ